MNPKTFLGFQAVLPLNALNAETVVVGLGQATFGFLSPKSKRWRNRSEWRTNWKRLNESSHGESEHELA